MNVARFIENLPTLANAPGGIPRLRELVLELAVRGKLTEQRAEDGTGEELFKCIQEAPMEGLPKRRGRKKNNVIALPKNELPFQTPKSWFWVQVEDLAIKLGAGSTPKGGRDVYAEEGVPFLRSQNVWNDGLRLQGVANITVDTHAKMNGTWVQPEDILLNITGASIGRSAVVPQDFAEGNVSQHVAIIRLADKALVPFMHVAVISPYFQAKIMGVQVGISREGLSMARLKEFAVPLPPLAEQKRIVEQVDRLMALLDDLEAQQKERGQTLGLLGRSAMEQLEQAESPAEVAAAWSRIQTHSPWLLKSADNLKRLRQCILQLAVQGKLVPQDSNDEPASELLKRIAHAKAKASRQGKEADLPAETEFEQCPKGWVETKLENLIYGFEAGKSFRAEGRPAQKDEFGVIKISAVTWGEFNPTENKALFPGDVPPETALIRKGDLLITRANTAALVGAVVVVKEDHLNLMLSDKTLRIKLVGDELDRHFIKLAMGADRVREIFEDQAKGTSDSMCNLSQPKIASAPIALPPLAEQKRIVAKVNQLFAVLDQAERALAESAQTAELFTRSACTHILEAS